MSKELIEFVMIIPQNLQVLLNLNKEMRLKTLLFFVFVITLLASFSLNEQTKSVIKSFSVAVFERVSDWSLASKPQQKFKAITDEKLLILNDFVAFTNKLVFATGEEILLHLSGRDELLVTIFNINADGLEKQHSKTKYDVSTPLLSVYSTFDGIITPTEKVSINSTRLGTGWFGIRVSDSKGTSIELPIYIDAKVIEKQILFVESTDTLLAYNPAYKTFSVPNYYFKNLDNSETHVVPYNTPITYRQLALGSMGEISCTDHLINSDAIHRKNLKNMGFDFQTVSDEKLDNPDTFKDVDIIIFGTHNEYWTINKARNVMNFVDNGGKVLFLGGNTAWRRIYREAKRTWIHGAGLRDNPTFEKLIRHYLGTYYTSIDNGTYAELSVLDEDFIGARFSQNVSGVSVLGEGTAFKHCENKIYGISGHETDELVDNAMDFIRLAKGNNEGGGADIVYKSFSSGGEILNFGSLSLWHNKDPIIFGLIQNFLEKVDR